MATRKKAGTTTTPPLYAAGTTVSKEKSYLEIQKLLKQYGATNCAYGEEGEGKATILFTMKERQYRISLVYPTIQKFASYGRSGVKTPLQMKAAQAKEIKRLWRALAMVIKAKIIAVQSGIREFEQEFFSDTLLKNEQTIFEVVNPQIEWGYLPLLEAGKKQDRKQIPDFIEGDFH